MIDLFKNQKDIEVSLFLERVLSDKLKFNSLLLHASGDVSYLKLIRPVSDLIFLVGHSPSEEVKNSVNSYFGDNPLLIEDVDFDCVVSFSELNYVGVVPKQVDIYSILQLSYFDKLLSLAKKRAYFSFILGEENLFENKYYCYDQRFLKELLSLAASYQIKIDYFANSNVDNSFGWVKVDEKTIKRFYNLPETKERSIAFVEIIKR